MDDDLARLGRRPPSPLADAISAALHPSLIVLVGLVIAGWHGTHSGLATLGWTVVSLVFVVFVPWLVLEALVRSGRVRDRHLVRRSDRLVPMTSAVVSLAGGLGALVWLGAPPPLLGLLGGLVVAGVIMTVVSLWFKASIHVSAPCLMAGAATAAFGWLAGGVVLPVVAAVGWARTRSGRHTVAQVVAGGVIGWVSGFLTYSVIVPHLR